MTSEIPKGLVLGLALLNIFVSNTDGGIEISLSKLAAINKQCGALHTLEERDGIHRRLVPPEREEPTLDIMDIQKYGQLLLKTDVSQFDWIVHQEEK
ncbi:hypothetical protein DUI87_18098 [Hirundo rustica rustica]|uniref:Uncharacterized protein n=1 Tax=Hirundo rustica rustica TaxID=333673 RepID=A0A3M0JV54_HIRRU|nr:hypothetical protein DUI87_18098 [Hirundo rustica rustica]